MDNKNRESERKRIKDMINKIETEEKRDDSYEQAADLSSLLDADTEPVMIDSQGDAHADDADAEAAVSLADLEDSDSQEDADPVPASEDAAADTSDTEAPKETSVDDAASSISGTEVAKVDAADDAVMDVDKTEAVKTAEVEDATPDADADDKKADALDAKEKEKNAQPAEETAEAVKEDKGKKDQGKEGKAKADKENDGKEKKKWIPKIQKIQLSKRNMIIIAAAAAVLLIACILIFSHSSSREDDNNIAVYNPGVSDVITYTDGTLIVNNVSVSVPTENATYNIAYDYGEDDVDYPTVPYSVSAIYFDKDGKSLYDISLRKESFTKQEDIPKGKDASNWFSDLATDDNENNLHKPKDSGSLHGFLISTAGDAKEGEAGTTYGSVSYSFALQDEDGLSVYALEGALYDKDSLNDFRKIMDDSINSIRTK